MNFHKRPIPLIYSIAWMGVLFSTQLTMLHRTYCCSLIEEKVRSIILLTSILGRKWTLTIPKLSSNRHQVTRSQYHLENLRSVHISLNHSVKDTSLRKTREMPRKHCSLCFECLKRRLFKRHALTIKPKIMFFRSIILWTLLYSCETWNLYRLQFKCLEQSQQQKLKKILEIQSSN